MADNGHQPARQNKRAHPADGRRQPARQTRSILFLLMAVISPSARAGEHASLCCGRPRAAAPSRLQRPSRPSARAAPARPPARPVGCRAAGGARTGERPPARDRWAPAPRTGAATAKGPRHAGSPNARGARGDGPDLSISLGPGKETDADSRSSGERTGRSPGGKPRGVVERRGGHGWNAGPRRVRAPGGAGGRVAQLGSAARTGGGRAQG